MIPVELPGGNFYPMLAASLICLATLLTWVAVLCTTRTARYWVRSHPASSLIVMGLLALVGAIFPAGQMSRWLAQRQAAREEATHVVVLAQVSDLGGVSMPAGTWLRLYQPGREDTYQIARFPVATEVAGIKAVQLTRYLEEKADASAYRVTGASATVAQDQAIAGWHCASRHNIEFKTTPTDDHLQFSSCHLGAGNSLDGLPLPAGTWLSARTGAGPAANPATSDGWLLRTDGSEAVTVLPLLQMPLLKADLRLDTQRRMVSFEGSLAKEWTLGPMTYPTGTRVATARAGLTGALPGDLVFSPSRGRSAHRDGGKDVAAGNSVLQGPDGAVRSVMDNRAAGVLDFASISVAP